MTYGSKDCNRETIPVTVAPSVRLRYGQRVEDLLDDVRGGEVFGFRLVGHDNAMAQDVGRDGLDVLRGDVAAAVDKRISLGRQGKRNRGTGGGADLDKALEIKAILLGLARCEHD